MNEDVNGKEIDSFFLLLRESIYGKKDVNAVLTDADWDKVYQLAISNKVEAVLVSSVSKYIGNDEKYTPLIESWKNRAFLSTMYESKKYFALRIILEEADKRNVKLVFFKGCIIADLYPKYTLRRSSDTDIFVYERDKESAIKLLEDLGYEKYEEGSKDQVPVYVNKKYLHYIELHFLLWEDYEGKKIDLLAGMGLVDENTLINITACDLNVITLGYEEHLIYQMFHLIKHFSIESINLRYLLDITLFINRYGDEINYKSFWDKMNVLGYKKFCVVFFALCIKYLDMSDRIFEDNMSELESVSEESMNLLLADMVNKGMIYKTKTASWQIMGIMTPYLTGEEKIPDSKLKRKLKVLFPSRKALPEKCNYARKYPVLLPIAWIHKMADFLIRYRKYGKDSNEWYGANEKLVTAEYRLNLMKNLELVEK